MLYPHTQDMAFEQPKISWAWIFRDERSHLRHGQLGSQRFLRQHLPAGQRRWAAWCLRRGVGGHMRIAFLHPVEMSDFARMRKTM